MYCILSKSTQPPRLTVCELVRIMIRLITIYDCTMTLEWTGVASDGTEVEGTLSIPEVSHEITLDRLSDYQVSIKTFDFTRYTRFTERIAFIK